MTDPLILTGLDGTNPLAFLAALGVLMLPSSKAVTLVWTDDVVPHPIVDGYESIDEIIDVVMAERDAWRTTIAVTFSIGNARLDDVKFSPMDVRSYIDACRIADDGGRSAGFAAALVAEGGRDNNGAAKPSDLHFTAGQQKFVRMARELIDGLERTHVEDALRGPWSYSSDLPSFMWDVTDDRVYAVSAYNPSSETKRTVPGAEFLAFLGLRMLPVFANGMRTLTTGCSGSWRQGKFVWPLWSTPATARSAQTIVAHAAHSADEKLQRWLSGWAVHQIVSCRIRRSDQGGYGSFSPPERWQIS